MSCMTFKPTSISPPLIIKIGDFLHRMPSFSLRMSMVYVFLLALSRLISAFLSAEVWIYKKNVGSPLSCSLSHT